MKTCQTCAKPLCLQNKVGLCRSCCIAKRNRDPDFKKVQLANRVMTPARAAAWAKVAEGNRKPLAERFGRVAKNYADNGCVEWLGGSDRKGYGCIRIDGKQSPATHAALILAGKDRPSPKHYALHACDNPPCVNPDHLRWGTQAENIQDCWAKGRAFAEGLTMSRTRRAKVAA